MCVSAVYNLSNLNIIEMCTSCVVSYKSGGIISTGQFHPLPGVGSQTHGTGVARCRRGGNMCVCSAHNFVSHLRCGVDDAYISHVLLAQRHRRAHLDAVARLALDVVHVLERLTAVQVRQILLGLLVFQKVHSAHDGRRARGQTDETETKRPENRFLGWYMNMNKNSTRQRMKDEMQADKNETDTRTNKHLPPIAARRCVWVASSDSSRPLRMHCYYTCAGPCAVSSRRSTTTVSYT